MAGNWKTRLLFYSISLGSSLLILQYWFLDSKIPSRKMSDQRIATKLFFSSGPQTLRRRNALKLVLFYTTLFGERPWRGLSNDYNFTNWNRIPCVVQACRISSRIMDLSYVRCTQQYFNTTQK